MHSAALRALLIPVDSGRGAGLGPQVLTGLQHGVPAPRRPVGTGAAAGRDERAVQPAGPHRPLHLERRPELQPAHHLCTSRAGGPGRPGPLGLAGGSRRAAGRQLLPQGAGGPQMLPGPCYHPHLQLRGPVPMVRVSAGPSGARVLPRGAAQVPSWSSGRSAQAFGSGTESPASKSHPWPQIGRRGPRVEHTLCSGRGAVRGLVGGPHPLATPQPTCSPAPERGSGPSTCTRSRWSARSHQAQHGGGERAGPTSARLGVSRLHAQGPTLCLQIDQPTLGMPSREHYFNEGSDQKVSQGQPTLDLPPWRFPAGPFHSGRPPPVTPGPTCGPAPCVSLDTSPSASHLRGSSPALRAGHADVDPCLCHHRRGVPEPPGAGSGIYSALQPRGAHLPSPSRQDRTAVHTAGSLHVACRGLSAGHPGPEAAPGATLLLHPGEERWGTEQQQGARDRAGGCGGGSWGGRPGSRLKDRR